MPRSDRPGRSMKRLPSSSASCGDCTPHRLPPVSNSTSTPIVHPSSLACFEMPRAASSESTATIIVTLRASALSRLTLGLPTML